MTRCHSSVLRRAARRSISSLRKMRARKVQKTWPRMPASVLWKIGRVAEQRFCGSEGILDRQQVAVTQDDLEGGDFGVGAQHEEAVEAGRGHLAEFGLVAP